MNYEILTSLILFGTFFFFLFLGFPIAFGILLSSFAAVLAFFILDYESFTEGTLYAINTVPQTLASAVEGGALLAIPLFIIAGNVMNRGGIALRLINLAKVIAAPLPGPLAVCNVIANTLFGAVAGIATAAAVAVGGTIQPHARKENYEDNFMAAMNAASAPSGLIIPPSGALILYSLYSGGTSIAALFIAGYIPGFIWCIAVLIPAMIHTTRSGYPRQAYPPLREILKVLLDALMPILFVFFIVGGILGWVRFPWFSKEFEFYWFVFQFTPVEASGMAVFFSILLSLSYREMAFRDIPKVFIDSVLPTAIATFLVASSGLMGYVLSSAQIPTLISHILLTISENPIVILLLINVMLLVLGTFMDLTPALIIFTPILYPILVLELGMDPVHLGIMLVFNLSIGLITPPVGVLLFVCCSIAQIPFARIVRPILAPLLLLILSLMLITYIPQISLFLPEILTGYTPK